jgi:ABC-type transport system involved in cytochrome bd biosynthesis fused ATPase/permease subunit
VAQRISTVLKADKIIVLDEGRVVAEGTHRELLQSSPIYQEIYDSQLGNGFRPEEADVNRADMNRAENEQMEMAA